VKKIERNAYTKAEFLARNGITKDRFYSEIGAGRLVARKAGKRVVVSADDEKAWLLSLPTIAAKRA
jgi:hypothetical protein